MANLNPYETYIYCLLDTDGNVKYVGKSNDPYKRYKVNRTSINYVLKENRNSAGGYKWKYNDIY